MDEGQAWFWGNVYLFCGERLSSCFMGWERGREKKKGGWGGVLVNYVDFWDFFSWDWGLGIGD